MYKILPVCCCAKHDTASDTANDTAPAGSNDSRIYLSSSWFVVLCTRQQQQNNGSAKPKQASPPARKIQKKKGGGGGGGGGARAVGQKKERVSIQITPSIVDALYGGKGWNVICSIGPFVSMSEAVAMRAKWISLSHGSIVEKVALGDALAECIRVGGNADWSRVFYKDAKS